MDSLDKHLTELSMGGPFSHGYYYDENGKIEDLLRKVILYSNRTKEILLLTDKPLLYYDKIYRIMLN